MRSPAGLTPSVTPSPRPPDQWASEPLAPGPGRAGTGASQAPGCPPAAVSPPPVGTSPSLDTLGGDRHRSRPVSIVQRPAYALYTHLTCKHTVHTPHVAHTHCTHVCRHLACVHTLYTRVSTAHTGTYYTHVLYNWCTRGHTPYTHVHTLFIYTHGTHLFTTSYVCTQLTCAHTLYAYVYGTCVHVGTE